MQDGRSDMNIYETKKYLTVTDSVFKEPLTITIEGEHIPDRFFPRLRFAWGILIHKYNYLKTNVLITHCHFVGNNDYDAKLNIK